jgi:menaquinone-dependent protoporphyrinogen oxidase
MRILITYASKHGATTGIAERIAQTFQRQAVVADVTPVADVKNIGEFDAVVVGSAVYYGSWMKDAVGFVRRNRLALSGRPVWLFSCGPLGAEANDAEQQPKDIGELQSAVGAQGHRVFFGALDPQALSLPERMVTNMIHAPAGDFRDWNAIETWATDIVRTLAAGEATSRSASFG